MAKFNYEAKKGPKEVIKGTIEADSKDAAVHKLDQMGYIPVRIMPAEIEFSKQKLPAQDNAKRIIHAGFFRKVRAKDLTIFTEQLAVLIKSKVPLLEAMEVLNEQTENAHLKAVISDVQGEIRDGRTLSQALNKYPRVFPLIYVNMIESGEAGGVLERTLIRLADFRNKDEEIRAKVVSALAYPIFIIIVGAATVFILLAFIIPRMASLFNEMSQTLPLPTRILLSLSDKIKDYWYWALAIVALGVFLLKRRRGPGKKEKIVFDRLKLKLPLLGDFIKKSLIARFSRTLAILLASGIPLFQAIKIVIPTLDNEIFKLELESVRKNIIDGMSLEKSIRKSSWFPRFIANMLAVGEKGGNLEEVLSEVANFYEREVDRTTKIITSLLEPVIILAIGLVVGFVVIAMLLPIFQINLGM